MTVENVDGVGHKVCLPIDGSDYARYAVNWYLKEMHKPGDTLLFVHCTGSPSLPVFNLTDGLNLPAGTWEKALEKNIAETISLKEECSVLCEHTRIPHEFVEEHMSKPGEAIVAAIRKYHADYVVIGCRGLGKIRRTILGSVSDYVLHHADVPCIIIPPEHE